MQLCTLVEDLSMYAYSNLAYLQMPIRGIVMKFHGLGKGTSVREDNPAQAYIVDEGKYYAERGLLMLYPYYGPWSWMNDVAVRYVDDVLDTAIRLLGLPEDISVVSTGGSMGGLGALMFTLNSVRHLKACAALCPVCDLVYHNTERRDTPRTLRLAFGHYPCPLDEAIRSNSPFHRIADLPDVPYYIVHGDADDQVNKENHSDKFAAAMRAAGKQITYVEVPGMKHCAWDEKVRGDFFAFVADCFAR